MKLPIWAWLLIGVAVFAYFTLHSMDGFMEGGSKGGFWGKP